MKGILVLITCLISIPLIIGIFGLLVRHSDEPSLTGSSSRSNSPGTGPGGAFCGGCGLAKNKCCCDDEYQSLR